MLRSTFAAFTTARSALNASQKALDVTGHNMANVNTDGYTRQRVDLFSVSAGSFTNRYAFKNSNSVGQGVKVGGISQIRDQFLDVRFRREFAKTGETDAKLSVLQNLEFAFDEMMTDGLGLGAQISDFISKLEALSKPSNTGNAEFDAMVRASAENLTRLFNECASQVSSVREEQSYQLESIYIPEVNNLLNNIVELNKNIRENQVFGNPALELQDERNILIDKLSQYLKIDVNYTPVEISAGIFVDNLSINLVSDTVPATYTSLIHNTDAVKLSYSEDAANGIATISMESNGTVTDITDKITGGTLKGVLNMLNKSGEFDSPANDTRGLGYYEKMLDVLASKFAEIFNEANSSTDLGNRPLFESRDGGSISAANIVVSQGWLNNVYGITASKDELPVTGDTSGANNNILYMISLFSSKMDFRTPTDPSDPSAGGKLLFNGTFEDFFSHIGSVLQLDVNSTEKLLNNYTSVLYNVMDLRDGISAVNLDEEGVNLLMYQKSYNAAARLMTILDEALDTLISRTGIIGR